MHEMHNSITQVIIGLSRVIQNIPNRINLSIFRRPCCFLILRPTKSLMLLYQRETLVFLKMYSSFNLNPTDYELQIRKTKSHLALLHNRNYSTL